MQNYILREENNAVERGVGILWFETLRGHCNLIYLPSTYFTENKLSNSLYGSLNSVMIKSHELEK